MALEDKLLRWYFKTKNDVKECTIIYYTPHCGKVDFKRLAKIIKER